MSQNSVKEFCLGEEDFQWLALNLPCSNSFSYYFKDNMDNIGGANIWTNFIYTYPRTICVQYLRILFCGFGKEDFLRFCIWIICNRISMFKLFLAIISLII